jgi:hypothetical protein
MTSAISPKSYLKQNVFEKVSVKKKKKITDDEFRMLSMDEYEQLKDNNYKVSQLKEICKFYKLKKSGNKNELITEIYNHLKYSLYAIKIQRIVRGNLLRKYIILAGPAIKLNNRKLCVNDTDFATLEPLNEIHYNQFFSFSDEEGTIYGCDVTSFYELLYKRNNYDINGKKPPLNPYNRRHIKPYILSNFSLYLRLARVNRIEQTTAIKEEVIDPSKQLEMKILELFQYINELGNYADSSWFSSLSRHMTILFIREVYDIWHYRAQLSHDTMRTIVPPHGNPFIGMNLQLAQTQSDEFVRKQAIKIIEYLVKSGHTTDNRSLGAYYVLAALTLVSEEARNALPWLFQSVSH